MAVLSIDRIVEALPDLRDARERGEVSDDSLIEALRAVGADILESPDVSRPVPPGRQIVVPFTRVHVSLTSAGFAMLEFAWSVVKIGGAFTVGAAPDPGDVLSFAGSAAQIYEASNRLDLPSGEFCSYLAIGRSKSRQAATTYPTSEQIAQSLETGGTDWCGMQCRFHAAGHATFGAPDVRAVLEQLREKGGVVTHHPPDGWWTTF
jgi:hypothetical protein